MIGELILGGIISKIISDDVDVSRNTIRKVLKNKKHENIDSQIYSVFINSLNRITNNQYKNKQEEIWKITEKLLKSFKYEHEKYSDKEIIERNLKIFVDPLYQEKYEGFTDVLTFEEKCEEFVSILNDEISKKENVELFHQVLLILIGQKNKYSEQIIEEINDKLEQVLQYMTGNSNNEEGEKFKNNKKQDYINNWNSRLFLHIGDNERPLTLADAFIMPDFDYRIKIRGYKFWDSDSLDNVIQKFMEYAVSLNMLIIGIPGIGKSSIVSWIANEYKYNDNVIILRFRDWKIEKLTGGLLNAICNSLSCENEDLENKILILDGFDEIKAVDICDSLLRNFFNDILDYKNFKFIITSRPDYIDSDKFQSVFELLPFGIDKIKPFYQIIKGSALDINKINHDNLNVLGIPVILYMALMVEIDITKDTTKPELYNRIFAEEGGIFDKFSYQGTAYDNGSQPLRDSENKKIYLRFLNNIAFKMFEKNELCLQKDECRIPKIEFNGSSMQVLEFPLKYLFENTKFNIEFIHKSIYEYFVAEYFYKILCDIEKYTIKQMAGKLGGDLKKGILEKEIIEFLTYKVKNNRMDKMFKIIIEIFNLMLRDGMTYYTNKRYKSIIGCEMNVFTNMLNIIHLWDRNHIKLDESIKNYLLYSGIGNLKLDKIDFQKLDLYRVNLRQSDLNSANLSMANLSRADLSMANLSRADLSMANLSKADLSVADLREADLSMADLREADLRGTDLSMANLRGTDLRGVKWESLNTGYIRMCVQETKWLKDNIEALNQLKKAKFEYVIIEDETGQKKVYRSELFPDEKQ